MPIAGMTDLTHFNAAGEAHMVDVGGKTATERRAVAEGRILMAPETLAHIRLGDNRKGDVLGVARIAGIMAAKRTADLIPLCHPLALTRVEVDLQTGDAPPAVSCRVTVETRDRTGVEMEALTGASVAALTLYDMCKAVDKEMRIEGVRVTKKTKGAS